MLSALKGYLSLPRALYPVIATHAILNILITSNRLMERTFFRTLVVCDETALLGGNFTGSAHCNDINTVLDTGMLLSGRAYTMLSICNTILSPVWAVVADRCGRKFVLKVSVIGFIMSNLLLVLAQGRDGQDSMVYSLASFALRGTTCNFGLVWSTMLADLTRKRDRSIAFGLLGLSNSCGGLFAGILSGWLKRQDLLDYSQYFLAGALMCFLLFWHVVLNVTETLAANDDDGLQRSRSSRANLSSRYLRSSLSSESVGSDSSPVVEITSADDNVELDESWFGFRAIVNDRVLVMLLLSKCLGCFSDGADNLTLPRLIGVYGWHQGQYELLVAPTSFVKLASVTVLLPLASTLAHNDQAPRYFWAGLLIVDSLVQLLVPLSSWSGAGTIVFCDYMEALLSFLEPLVAAALSELVANDERAKFGALSTMSSMFAKFFTIRFFTGGRFHARATGFEGALPFLIAAACHIAAMAIDVAAVAPGALPLPLGWKLVPGKMD